VAGAARRLSAVLAFAETPEFAELCRGGDPAAFTRRRKLTAGVVAMAALCSANVSSECDALVLAEAGAAPMCSRQAWDQARAKMDPGAMRALMEMHARSFFDQEGASTLFGLVPIAIDGSGAELPTCAATLAEWGGATGRRGGREGARMGISAAVAALDSTVVSVEAEGAFFDERALVLAHLDAAERVVGTPDLLATLDRGYPSFSLIAGLLDAGRKFLMRCESGFMSPEFAACAEAGGDLEVEVALTRSRLKHQSPAERDGLAGRRLRLRLVLVDIGTGAPERLITNLPPEAAAAGGLRDAYSARWNVETAFGGMKGPLRLEEGWRGRSRGVLLQNLYATALLLNVLEDMRRDATEVAVSRGASTSAEGAVGIRAKRSFGACVLKLGLRRAARDPGRAYVCCLLMVEEMSASWEPVRPDRHYPRDALRHGGRRRATCTSKRAF